MNDHEVNGTSAMAKVPGGEDALWGVALTCGDLDRTKDTVGDMLSDPKITVQPAR